MHQSTLAEGGFVKHHKTTRKAKFLAKMGRIVPWERLVRLVEEHYPNPQGAGRCPGAGRMLRVHGIVFLISVGLGLSGCQTTSVYKAPTIVDIDDSKVVVQRQFGVPVGSFTTLNSATINDVKNIAEEGCANYKGKEAVLLSETCGLLGESVFGAPICVATNYLFACKDE